MNFKIIISADADYRSTRSLVTLSAGSGTGDCGCVTISIIEDTALEATEYFFITAGWSTPPPSFGPISLFLLPNITEVVIVDNDREKFAHYFKNITNFARKYIKGFNILHFKLYFAMCSKLASKQKMNTGHFLHRLYNYSRPIKANISRAFILWYISHTHTHTHTHTRTHAHTHARTHAHTHTHTTVVYVGFEQESYVIAEGRTGQVCLVLRSTGTSFNSATVLENPLITRVMSVSNSASGIYAVTLDNLLKGISSNNYI